MRPVVTVRTYTPRQVIFTKENRQIVNRNRASRLSRSCRLLRLIFVALLGLGLGVTHSIHYRVVELQSSIDALKTSNAAIADKNSRLEAADAQLCSKTAVVALLAKRKLKLIEPVDGQVHRVQTKI